MSIIPDTTRSAQRNPVSVFRTINPPAKRLRIVRALSQAIAKHKSDPTTGAWCNVPRSKTSRATDQLSWVTEHFDDAVRNGDVFRARCPLHDDNKPSLSIAAGKNGGVVVHCHAGCLTSSLLSVVGLSLSDLAPDAKRIVAEYDYEDADGRLLYQSLRYEPKDFCCRRPDGNGGWVYREVFDGVQRVPYRLPELRSADFTDFVLVVEGEKDVDRLIEEGFVATCNVGGARKWLDEYNAHFAGRHVALLPDNDDPGREHAADVARRLSGVAASVKVVELPGLPSKGDVSDYFDAGGSAAKLRKLIQGAKCATDATEDATGEKRVSSTKTKGVQESVEVLHTLQGFPVEVFPVPLQRFIRSTAKALPCPVDFPGVMMLPVLSTAIGRKRCVEIKEGWREFPSIWTACIARSGDRKTPAAEKVIAPLRTKQRQFQVEYSRARKAWEKTSKKTPPPRLKQILTTDTTIEALKDVLSGNPNGVLYSADELSGWVRSMSQYKAGRGDDRQHWLSIWSGVQIVSNRKGVDPVVINDPFVCVTGGIQPDALGDLIDDGREDGFSARILYAYPEPVSVNDWNEEVVEGADDYAKVCEALSNLVATDAPVMFSPAAKKVWISWVNEHRREAPPDHLEPVWSKMEGYCARIALVLFLSRVACGETKATTIDVESVRGAVKLIAYFKSHARRVYKVYAEKTEDSRVAKTLKWIRKRGGEVTARDVQMNHHATTAEKAKELLTYLSDSSYGTVTEKAKGSVVFRLSVRT